MFCSLCIFVNRINVLTKCTICIRDRYFLMCQIFAYIETGRFSRTIFNLIWFVGISIQMHFSFRKIYYKSNNNMLPVQILSVGKRTNCLMYFFNLVFSSFYSYKYLCWWFNNIQSFYEFRINYGTIIYNIGYRNH